MKTNDLDHDELDLIGLLTGTLDRDGLLATGRHLRGCTRCAQELVDLAVAHGSLTSSARALEVLDGMDALRLVAMDGPVLGTDDELPPLRLDGDGDGAGERSGPFRTRGRKVALGVAGAAAAVSLVAGAGGAALVASGSNTHPSGSSGSTAVASGHVVAEAALTPIDAPTTVTGSIKAVAVGSTRTLMVDTSNLVAPGHQHFYEVWLLNPSTQKMLPMGVLSPSGSGTYSVGASIMAGYSAVDISLQANDGNPAHSSTSVLRAIY